MLNVRNKDLLTAPNILSLYRLFSFPVVLYFIVTKNQPVFVSLLIFNLITDILDGYIARKYHMETEFGARLDSLADEGTYILGLTGIYIFKKAELDPYSFGLMLFAGSYGLSLIIGLVKFKMLPCLHLFSSKTGAYMQGFFFFMLFVFGFYHLLFYITLIWGIALFFGTNYHHADSSKDEFQLKRIILDP